jgi:hypothetical protein
LEEFLLLSVDASLTTQPDANGVIAALNEVIVEMLRKVLTLLALLLLKYKYTSTVLTLDALEGQRQPLLHLAHPVPLRGRPPVWRAAAQVNPSLPAVRVQKYT